MTTKAELWRYNDARYLRVALEVTDRGGSQFVFMSNGRELPILSATGGYTFENKLTVLDRAEVIVDAGPVQCLCRKGNDWVEVPVEVPLASVIRRAEPKPVVIRTVSKKYKDRMSEFLNIVRRKKSSWIITLEDRGDLFLSVISSPDEKRLMCVGAPTETLTAADFVFPMFPGKQALSIPRELIKGSRIAVYEIAVPDFVPSPDFYHKIIASNIVGEQ